MKRTPRTPLSSELVFTATKMTAPEVRALVFNYHDAQDKRKAGDMQTRHIGDKTPVENIQPEIGDDAETVEGKTQIAFLLQHYIDEQVRLEKDIAKALGEYAQVSSVGRWMMEQIGIGPVVAAGYLAHIDIEKCPTVGHIWSFSGLNPDQKWEKGQKRPFSADMKQLAHHARECFKRSSNHPDHAYPVDTYKYL
jgi:hypothetical protein